MIVEEHVPLAPLTTLGVGGSARFLIRAESEEDIEEAIGFAQEQNLPLYVLGNGSNILVPDEGIAGVVLLMLLKDISIEEKDGSVCLTSGAGVPWDSVVDTVCKLGIFGLENLAGVPGTLGGAAVQNIGAYGTEFSESFAYADTINRVTGERARVNKDENTFGYRTSFFKRHPELIITNVTLCLSKSTKPNISYPDITKAKNAGAKLDTPSEIATVVRNIRAEKFPIYKDEGVAGSFFKNPVISGEQASELVKRFPELPVFPQENGNKKVSLAWLLDHALGLKGYKKGYVRLYEKQPIVIVASTGATALDVILFANEIAEKVLKEINIQIEREVEIFGEEK